jgi:outer membrane receptor for ferrienterochelin and colicins
VVTATRTARVLEDVPVPTTVVTDEEIEARGALRLADLLAEQPGLTVVGGLGGSALQVQGFSADYTLILVDGEPLVGRTAGTLDLERLTVTNVERVEVVRGPLSARYGTDALAGVVNLITRRPGGRTAARVKARYESHGASDLSASAETGGERWGVRTFVNRFGSDGFSLRPETGTLTVPVFSDYAAETRVWARPHEGTDLDVRARVATQQQEGVLLLSDGLYDDTASRTDWSLAPTVRHRFSRTLTLDASLYGTRFENASETVAQGEGGVFDATNFVHSYGKAEAGVTWLPSARHIVYVGGGVIGERVSGERYSAAREATQPFAYAEAEWLPNRLVNLVLSARYDAPSDYAARLTPQVAALVRPLSWLRLRASVGSGYKAPAFRQRYLVFTNEAGGGYSVFGAEEVAAELAALDAAGGIDAYLLDPSSLGALRAESSTAYGLGAEVEPVDGLVAKVNLFHNEVRDLIDTQPVAAKTNGQQVFSYFNLNRVYTRGVEAELQWVPMAALSLGVSYQFLDTADRDVLDQIEAGALYVRGEDGRDVRVTRADYGGLAGRSRHSGTFRLTHRLADLGLTTAARLVLRGRYGYANVNDSFVNGNVVIDDDAEYAPGYALAHLTVTKTFGPADVQLGVRNLLGHTDAERLPAEPGRVLFVGAGLRF